ncbi:MAG: GntR family transcriptional regulator [Roseovarius sp.]
MTTANPTRDQSLSDEIYDTLKTRLILGQYSPGDRLSMRKLAGEFGTSAMPVREALKRLSSQQVIESAAAKAFNIPSLSRQRAANLFELRALLESAAVEAIPPDVAPNLLDQLEALCDRMETHLRQRDFAAYLIDNHRFHFVLYRQADNPDLTAMIEQLWMKTGPSLLQGLQGSQTTNPDWNTEHRRLCDALRRGQITHIGAIMRADVEWGADFYRS